MPVISPRRSSSSASSNIYGTLSSTGGSSSIGSSSYSSSSYNINRASSLSKGAPSSSSSSTYSPSYSYLSSYSYSPRTTAQRSSSTYSTLSGGSSALGSYRNTSAYTGTSNYDTTTSSRYGLYNKKSKVSDSLKKDDSSHEARKPPSGLDSSGQSKRFSGSYSSSSLARLVATSGLDIYEKYSPAHYKPTCELSRSRSAVGENAIGAEEDNDSNNISTQNSSINRPRSRYSRLFSSDDAPISIDTTDDISSYRTRHKNDSKLLNSSSASALSNSSSSSDVPTATFTLRSNRFSKSTRNEDNVAPTNGEVPHIGSSSVIANNNNVGNGFDGMTTVNIKIKDLKVSTPGSDLNEDDISIQNNNKKISSIKNAKSDNEQDLNNTNASEDDIIATATLNLDSSSPKKSSKIRSSSTRSVLPPLSPTAGRYSDRETTRTSTYSSSIHNNSDEVNKSSSSDEKLEGLCGLKNIGNTCFMNSIIQCLSHTSELTKFLKSHNGVRSSPSKDQQILYEFARLIRDMWSSGTRSVTPMELKRSFSAKHRMYSDYNQQDAQEFLRFFLDSLHCALNNGVKGGSLKIDESLSDNKKADLTWEWYSRQENSLIRDLFVGQLKSTLKCTICNNASVTFDPFWDLSVPLPSSSRCKLDACLDLFIREEVLDGDEMPTCSKCRTRRKCTKSFTIQRFPKYLVIHLKRFSETRWSKLSNIVEFPTGEGELNMGPYASNKSSNIYYSLYAISNHMGSTAGGHYVALCKHPASKKWHEFNDNVVSDAVPESHLTSSSAYILFYERM